MVLDLLYRTLPASGILRYKTFSVAERTTLDPDSSIAVRASETRIDGNLSYRPAENPSQVS